MYVELQYELWKKVIAKLPKRKARVKPKKRPSYFLHVYKGTDGTIMIKTFPFNDNGRSLYSNEYTLVYPNISSFMYNWDIECRLVLTEKIEEVTDDYDPAPF